MSEQSDYDRLRADVLALSKEVFHHGTSGWIDSKFDELLEKHPAKRSAPETTERAIQRFTPACDDPERPGHCGPGYCGFMRPCPDGEWVSYGDHLNCTDILHGKLDSKQPPPQTPARATAVSALVESASQYVEAMGPCDHINEDSDESYCTNAKCRYCALTKAVDSRELDL